MHEAQAHSGQHPVLSTQAPWTLPLWSLFCSLLGKIAVAVKAQAAAA